MTHGRTVCTHGALISQCRCMDHGKSTTVVACPWPEQHKSYPTIEARIRPDRYAQCDATCTTDCGACKGNGPPVRAEVERVARAIAAESRGLPSLDDDGWEYYFRADEQDDFLRAARAALAALGPATEAEAAVARVRALVDEAETELRDISRGLFVRYGVRFRWDILDRLHAALAVPEFDYRSVAQS